MAALSLLAAASALDGFDRADPHEGVDAIRVRFVYEQNVTVPPNHTSVNTTPPSSAPPTTLAPIGDVPGDVVYGNITADYSKGTFGRVQRDMLYALGVAGAFTVIALLECFLPMKPVKTLSPSDLMQLEQPLLLDTEILEDSSSNNGSFVSNGKLGGDGSDKVKSKGAQGSLVLPVAAGGGMLSGPPQRAATSQPATPTAAPPPGASLAADDIEVEMEIML